METIAKELPKNKDPIETLDWLDSYEDGHQFKHVYAMQVLKQVEEMPMNMKRMAYKMADGANLIEAAQEMEIDIIQAMKLQRATRGLARIMAEVEADEKRDEITVSPHAIKRSVARHAVDISHRKEIGRAHV